MGRCASLLVALPWLLALAPLAALAAPPPRHVSEAPDWPLRVGLEAGLAWYGPYPDQAPGGSGALRLHWQPSERLFVSAALQRLRQSFPGAVVDTTLIPLTLDLRLDRAPISPFIGAGVGFILLQRVGGTTMSRDFGAVLEVGLEARLTDRLAFTTQATYQGVSAPDQTFPFFSALTAGLEAGF